VKADNIMTATAEKKLYLIMKEWAILKNLKDLKITALLQILGSSIKEVSVDPLCTRQNIRITTKTQGRVMLA